jgi:hypothetical protein
LVAKNPAEPASIPISQDSARFRSSQSSAPKPTIACRLTAIIERVVEPLVLLRLLAIGQPSLEFPDVPILPFEFGRILMNARFSEPDGAIPTVQYETMYYRRIVTNRSR